MKRVGPRSGSAGESSDDQVVRLSYEVSRLQEEIAALEANAQLAVVERDGARTELARSAASYAEAQARADAAEEQLSRLAEARVDGVAEAPSAQAEAVPASVHSSPEDAYSDDFVLAFTAEAQHAEAVQDTAPRRFRAEKPAPKAAEPEAVGAVAPLRDSGEAERLRAELLDKDLRLDDAERARVRLGVENAQLQAEVSRLEAEVAATSDRGGSLALAGERTAYENEIERLKTAVRDLESSLTQSLAQTTAAEDEVARVRRHVTEVEDEAAVLRASAVDAKELEATVIGLRETNARLEDSVARAHQRVAEAEDELAALTSQSRRSEQTERDLAEMHQLVSSLRKAQEDGAERVRRTSELLQVQQQQLDAVNKAIGQYALGEVNEFGFIRSVSDVMQMETENP